MFILEEWEKIPMKTIHNLFDSMPRRLQQVLASKGEKIDY